MVAQNLDVLGTIKLKIRISNFTWYIEFVVVSFMSMPLILGTPFFERLDYVWIFVPAFFIFNSNQSRLVVSKLG